MQAKGNEYAELQQQYRQLQDELHAAEAVHVKVLSPCCKVTLLLPSCISHCKHEGGGNASAGFLGSASEQHSETLTTTAHEWHMWNTHHLHLLLPVQLYPVLLRVSLLCHMGEVCLRVAQDPEEGSCQPKCSSYTCLLPLELQATTLCLVQELTDTASSRLKLKQDIQQKDALIQQLQQQLQAAAQHAQRVQQQTQLQILRTYRAAAATSAEHLQDLKERYFHSVPSGPRPGHQPEQGIGKTLKMPREDIVAAYTEFQQRRGGIQSMPSMPATPSSHSSTARRNFLSIDSRVGSLRQPWQQGSISWSAPPETPTAVSAQEPSIAAAHGVYSFALRSINRSASTSPVKRGSPEQLVSPRQPHSHLSPTLHSRQDAAEPADTLAGPPPVALSSSQADPGSPPRPSLLTLPQAESSSSALGDFTHGQELGQDQGQGQGQSQGHGQGQAQVQWQGLGHDSVGVSHSSEASATGLLPDVQPQPNWQLPFLQQLVQFEACLLTALMALPKSPKSALHSMVAKRTDRTAL